MDKRIIILIIIFFVASLSFFLYRKLYYRHEGISYKIRPRGVIHVNDSIHYEDLTPGATRWKWDFGDGEYSADQSGIHSFLQPGRFKVALTTYGPFGVLKDSQSTVDVISSNIATQINTTEPAISGPAELRAGQSAEYKTSLAAESYEWKADGDNLHAQRGSTATYSFNKPGIHSILLTLHNPDSIMRKNVNVIANAAPVLPLPPRRPTPRPTRKDDNLPDLSKPVPYHKQNQNE